MTNQEALSILEDNFNPVLKQYVITIPLHVNELTTIKDIGRPYSNVFKLADLEIFVNSDGKCDYIKYQDKPYYKWKELKTAVLG